MSYSQGNIISILDSLGFVVVRYEYDAWGVCKIYDANGNVITNNDTVNANPFRYRGYYYDVDTGLYYLPARYYDPTTGRFISADDIEYADPETINGLNLYAYCGNNPVMNIDPSGHSFLAALIIGALVGMTSYAMSKGVEYIITGTFNWSWGEFFGSMIGGALGGGIGSVFATIPMLAAGVGGFFTTAFSMIGGNITGETHYTWGQITTQSLTAGLFSAITAGIFKGFSNFHAKVNLGSFLFNNPLYGRINLSSISGRVFAENFVDELIKDRVSRFLNRLYNAIEIKK